MCGRYTLVTKLEKVEKRFNVRAGEPQDFRPQVNIGPGMRAAVITSEAPHALQFFTFGLTPFWAKKPMYLFNARSEGDFNKENNTQYSGNMGILQKPAFRKPIRSQRCLVPADCFFEGPEREKLTKPYVVYHQTERPFAFAGVYDAYVNRDTGEITHGFSILTTVSNSVTAAIGHHRSPIILSPDDEEKWLNPNTELGEVTELLKPTDGRLLNAYPVSTEVKSPGNQRMELLRPTGERIKPEYEFSLLQELKLQGMGMTTGRQRRLFE